MMFTWGWGFNGEDDVLQYPHGNTFLCCNRSILGGGLLGRKIYRLCRKKDLIFWRKEPTDRSMYRLAVIRKAKDTSLKLILDEPELFVEFIRDFINIDILKDISPADVEDVTDRLLPLLTEQKDLDTIKRINLKDKSPLFVITIVDHESTVNFRASFKMFLYIAFVLDNYEKEVNKQEAEKRKAEGQEYKGKITQTKSFKYPPILPIVFYDGEDEWTAETNFFDRVEMNDIFAKYIPKFEYELVSLKKYSFEDLAEFRDVLSLFMMVDKLKSAEAFSEFGKLPKDYIEQLDSMNVPPHLKELLVRIITMLLRKIDVPQDEIDVLVEKLDERGISQMLAIENYSVQETRREARAEARLEQLVKQIYKKKLKLKTREQIIDELELEPDEIEILDNFELYEHLI